MPPGYPGRGTPGTLTVCHSKLSVAPESQVTLARPRYVGTGVTPGQSGYPGTRCTDTRGTRRRRSGYEYTIHTTAGQTPTVSEILSITMGDRDPAVTVVLVLIAEPSLYPVPGAVPGFQGAL
eukprot:2230176-Rhodomonas_salina.7